jgi:hypothetical protein
MKINVRKISFFKGICYLDNRIIIRGKEGRRMQRLTGYRGKLTLSILFTILLMFSILPASAFAAPPEDDIIVEPVGWYSVDFQYEDMLIPYGITAVAPENPNGVPIGTLTPKILSTIHMLPFDGQWAETVDGQTSYYSPEEVEQLLLLPDIPRHFVARDTIISCEWPVPYVIVLQVEDMLIPYEFMLLQSENRYGVPVASLYPLQPNLANNIYYALPVGPRISYKWTELVDGERVSYSSEELGALLLFPYTPRAFVAEYVISVGAPGSGDLNGDGIVTVGESVLVARVIAGMDAMFTPEQIAAVDMDGDGVLTVTDAILMLRKIAGL